MADPTFGGIYFGQLDGASGTIHAVAVSDTGVGTDTGALVVTRSIATSDGGSSSDTGSILVTHTLLASDAGSGSDSAALTVVGGSIAASDSGTSSDTGDLRVAHSLVVVDAGDSTDAGVLFGEDPLPWTISSAIAGSDTSALKINRGWNFVLYESNIFDEDLHPITGLATPGLHTRVRTFTKASNKSVSFLLNRPGSAKFDLPIDSPEALDVVGYEIKRSIIVFINPTTIGADPIPVWSGYISNVILSVDSSGKGSVSVTCTGWMQMLYSREFRMPYSFTATNPDEIALRLLGTANNQVVNGNTGTDGSLAENLLGDAGDLESMVYVTAGTKNTFRTEAWAISTVPEITKTWDFTSPILPSGQYGLFMGTAYVDASNKSGDVLIGSQFDVTAGQQYAVRFLANMKRSTNASCTANLQLLFWNAGGTPLATSTISINRTLGVKEVTGTVTAPATATKCQVKLEVVTAAASDECACIYDAICVTKVNASVTGVGVTPLPIKVGTVTSPAGPTTRTPPLYQTGEKIGKSIEELSNIESGFDYQIRMSKETITGGNTYVRRIDIKWVEVKTGTSIYGIGQDRPDVVFGYQWGGASNLGSLTESRDGANLATRINARSTNKLAMSQDIDQIKDIGLWEDSLTVSDQSIKNDVLLGYAGAETAYRASPTRRFNPTPVPYDGTYLIPAVFSDYELGDIVYMVADRGAMKIGTTSRQAIRVFGFTVNVDGEGNERISELQTTASQ